MRSSDVKASPLTPLSGGKSPPDIILLQKDLAGASTALKEGSQEPTAASSSTSRQPQAQFVVDAVRLVASFFLPFLPMSALQLLSSWDWHIPLPSQFHWDNVDDSFLSSPRSWDIIRLQTYALDWTCQFSNADLCTYVLCGLSCARRNLGRAIAARLQLRRSFILSFQTGWFIRSWTQTFVLHSEPIDPLCSGSMPSTAICSYDRRNRWSALFRICHSPSP